MDQGNGEMLGVLMPGEVSLKAYIYTHVMRDLFPLQPACKISRKICSLLILLCLFVFLEQASNFILIFPLHSIF